MVDDVPLISIVSPAFNEEETLPRFHAAVSQAVEPLRDRFRIELIIVDDGSHDGTLGVLRALAARDSRVRYLALSRNFGNQAALTAGLEHAAGDAVITLDCDLQHPPELIPQLVAKWLDGHDVVLTVRAEGKDQTQSWFKRNTSMLFHRILRRWSNMDVRVEASDYRLLSRKALDGLLRMRESHRYIRGLVQWLGFNCAEVPFHTAPRVAGESRYTLSRLMRLAFDGLFSFSRAPLRLAVGLGLTAVAFSFALTLMALAIRGGDLLFAALLIAIHVVGASVLSAVGVLGAYIIRIFEECKNRPLYLLKESSPSSVGETRALPLATPAPTIGRRRDSSAA